MFLWSTLPSKRGTKLSTKQFVIFFLFRINYKWYCRASFAFQRLFACCRYALLPTTEYLGTSISSILKIIEISSSPIQDSRLTCAQMASQCSLLGSCPQHKISWVTLSSILEVVVSSLVSSVSTTDQILPTNNLVGPAFPDNPGPVRVLQPAIQAKHQSLPKCQRPAILFIVLHI